MPSLELKVADDQARYTSHNFFKCAARCCDTLGRYHADHLSGMIVGKLPLLCVVSFETRNG